MVAFSLDVSHRTTTANLKLDSKSHSVRAAARTLVYRMMELKISLFGELLFKINDEVLLWNMYII